MSFNLVRLTLYGLIVAIDADLRALVVNQLASSKTPENIFPSELLAKLEARAEKEGGIDRDDLCEYLDFNDSVQVLNRHKSEIDRVVSKFLAATSDDLQKLASIRNRVMHARPLQFSDYSVVDDFVKQIKSFPKSMFRRTMEFEEKVRDNPNFVYSIDINGIEKSQGTIPHNLPIPDYDETGFLGREQETADLLTACKSNWPVITIVGEGGFGKTALALRVAYDLLDDEKSGLDAIVWTTAKRTVLTLGDIQTIDGAIQSSLGLIKSASEMLGGTPDENKVMDEVSEYLNNFKILLILDNLETVLDPLLTKFIRKSNGKSKILCTSRVGIGEMSYPFKLGGMSADDGVQLLRATAKIRRVKSIAQSSKEALKRYVQQMKLNPGFIKWFVSCVQCDIPPEKVLANPVKFLDFCLSNVYDYVSDNAKTICKAMLAVPGRQSLSLISYLTKLSGDALQEAIANLQFANIVRMDSVHTKAGSETVYELSDIPRLYLLRNHSPDLIEDSMYKHRKREVVQLYERLQAERDQNNYDLKKISCRNQADAITARLLSDALKACAEPNIELALELVDQARALDPAFYEVYRVEAWIHSRSGNLPAAAAAYENALELEGNSAPLRYWYAGFLLRSHADPDGAYSQLNLAHALDPEAVVVSTELARVEMYLGRYSHADARLESVLSLPHVPTKYRRIAYDTWCQVQLRQANRHCDDQAYPESLSACQELSRRARSIPPSLLDEKLCRTVSRVLTVLTQLSSKLSFSSLAQDVELCRKEIIDFQHQAVPKAVENNAQEDKNGAITVAEMRHKEGEELEGVVDMLKFERKYGFIRFEEKNRIFFHFSSLKNPNSKIRMGMVVRFTVVESGDKVKAENVEVLNDEMDLSEDFESSHSGVVKSVVSDRSFGFITNVNGEDLFFHRSNMMNSIDFDNLSSGDKVEYRLGMNEKGVVADNIVLK